MLGLNRSGGVWELISYMCNRKGGGEGGNWVPIDSLNLNLRQ